MDELQKLDNSAVVEAYSMFRKMHAMLRPLLERWAQVAWMNVKSKTGPFEFDRIQVDGFGQGDGNLYVTLTDWYPGDMYDTEIETICMPPKAFYDPEGWLAEEIDKGKQTRQRIKDEERQAEERRVSDAKEQRRKQYLELQAEFGNEKRDGQPG